LEDFYTQTKVDPKETFLEKHFQDTLMNVDDAVLQVFEHGSAQELAKEYGVEILKPGQIGDLYSHKIFKGE
jgi:hypothetical protein